MEDLKLEIPIYYTKKLIIHNYCQNNFNIKIPLYNKINSKKNNENMKFISYNDPRHSQR